jgi:hypothetical protein
MNENASNQNLANNHLVGVIDGPESARQAVQDLQRAGFGEPVVYSGEEGARQIDANGEHGSLFGRILSLVEDHLSEATNFMKQYEQEARDGKQVIALEVPSAEEAEGARVVLDRNGARNIRFFGKLAVTDLSPESNPSHRSPESQAT